jgi:hypothetical protein
MINQTKTDENLNLIRQVIENYAAGADQRDIDKLDKAFHENFRVIAVTDEGVRNLDKETYLNLIKGEKIGGVERDLEIEWITTKNDTARAEVWLKSGAVVFNDDLSFIRDQQEWQIINNVTQVVPV